MLMGHLLCLRLRMVQTPLLQLPRHQRGSSRCPDRGRVPQRHRSHPESAVLCFRPRLRVGAPPGSTEADRTMHRRWTRTGSSMTAISRARSCIGQPLRAHLRCGSHLLVAGGSEFRCCWEGAVFCCSCSAKMMGVSVTRPPTPRWSTQACAGQGRWVATLDRGSSLQWRCLCLGQEDTSSH